MNDYPITTIKKFSEEIVEKNKLLKRLNDSYTKALGYMDNQNYNALNSELDIQDKLLAEIGEPDSKESDIISEYESFREKSITYYGTEYSLFTTITEDITAYKRLLKNCKTLNEKLVYQVKEKMMESKLHISALKTRKLINSGYKTGQLSEKGSHIDFISN